MAARGDVKLGLEGEIVISSDTAISQGAEYGNDPQRELLLYVVHGVLHLMDYDDQTESAERAMRAREAGSSSSVPPSLTRMRIRAAPPSRRCRT